MTHLQTLIAMTLVVRDDHFRLPNDFYGTVLRLLSILYFLALNTLSQTETAQAFISSPRYREKYCLSNNSRTVSLYPKCNSHSQLTAFKALSNLISTIILRSLSKLVVTQLQNCAVGYLRMKGLV